MYPYLLEYRNLKNAGWPIIYWFYQFSWLSMIFWNSKVDNFLEKKHNDKWYEIWSHCYACPLLKKKLLCRLVVFLLRRLGNNFLPTNIQLLAMMMQYIRSFIMLFGHTSPNNPSCWCWWLSQLESQQSQKLAMCVHSLRRHIFDPLQRHYSREPNKQTNMLILYPH